MALRKFLPSLSALQAFQASAHHRSFTKAAEDLGITQSGISRQVKNLEDFLGVRLFERNGSRVILTQHGAQYLRQIEVHLEGLETASLELLHGETEKPALVVGSTPTFAQCWLASRVDGFMSAEPKQPLNLVGTDNEMTFEDTEIDIAILRGSGAWPGAISYELFPEELWLIASTKLIPADLNANGLRLEDYSLLQCSSRPSSWVTWLRAKNISHNGPINGPQFANTAMLVNAVAAGVGIGVVPTVLSEKSSARGVIHSPFGAPIKTGESFYAVYPENKAHSRSVISFRDWLIRETRYLNSVGPSHLKLVPSAGS